MFFLINLFAFIYHLEINDDKKLCGFINFFIQIATVLYYLFLMGSMNDIIKEYEEEREKINYYFVFKNHKNYKRI